MRVLDLQRWTIKGHRCLPQGHSSLRCRGCKSNCRVVVVFKLQTPKPKPQQPKPSLQNPETPTALNLDALPKFV